MNIVIVGLGYVGVTGAACLSAQGHTVHGVDVNPDKVESLNAGRSPIAEPGVDELLQNAHREGRLTASTEIPSIVDQDLVVVCVGTPSAADGSHNMNYIIESSRQIANAIQPHDRQVTVAFRSTFRPGTMNNLIAPLFADLLGLDFEDRVELVYNPEFLRESTAVADYFTPPKIVVGTRSGSPSDTLDRANRGIESPVFNTGYREAELTKFVDNTWHAVKVAFANEVGRVCEAHDVDASVVHEIFTSDTKLNISAYYMRPGGAFGGSCLPKDVRAMQYLAESEQVEVPLFHSLLTSNEKHIAFQTQRVLDRVESGSKVLVIGVAFKKDTDDMRESPSVRLVADLIKKGYDVRVYDPVVQMSLLVGQNLSYVLTTIPTLRDLLIDESAAAEFYPDLAVLNHPLPESLSLPEATPLLDLRVIGGPR